MVGELHDISVAIGAIQAETENARRSREATHRKLEDIISNQDAMKETVAKLVMDVNALSPEVKHYADLRRRLVGAMGLMALLGGAAVWLIDRAASLISFNWK